MSDEPANTEPEQQERVTMPEYCRKLARRLERTAEYFDRVADHELPVNAAYVEELMDWFSYDHDQLQQGLGKLFTALNKGDSEPEARD